ncbi:twin-arginine translocase subunit TatC [Prevotella sp. E13-27]|uniref:twin-arginine translocase subunit TatC n=1 Tax=Prevotella sp. E13-27 TaxID=2938122 RepID=UPI00200B4BFD|nr:twin-arginine translocase subunit TatC [Prevotella sp. E13-27]MCK8620838.1 twin-arginine translocase subunit TatC [Prevotella sp. E13-27]
MKQKRNAKKPTEQESNSNPNQMTFGGHLEVLRQMLFRILAVAGIISIVVFYFKDSTWSLLLAPSEWDFCTYRWIESAIQSIGLDFHFDEFHVEMIATDLSSQFMTHITTAVYLGLLGASPYILYELFCYISPALYENERKYSVQVAGIIYVLFILGVLMSYFILFPISFRFLGTYSVSTKVTSNITLDSYISTFASLTLVMGIVFQLPVIAYFLGKMGVITSELLSKYRKHSFLVIMLIAAIITPPDLMTLILVSIPLYLLYEVSIRVVRRIEYDSKHKK